MIWFGTCVRLKHGSEYGSHSLDEYNIHASSFDPVGLAWLLCGIVSKIHIMIIVTCTLKEKQKRTEKKHIVLHMCGKRPRESIAAAYGRRFIILITILVKLFDQFDSNPFVYCYLCVCSLLIELILLNFYNKHRINDFRYHLKK